MTTPPSGQISMGDLKSELSLVGGPSYDINLSEMNRYVMANGFYDTYNYNYISGGGAQEVPLSNFYSLQTDGAYGFRVQVSVTDYNTFNSTLFNQSVGGGIAGAQAQPNQFQNPSSPLANPFNSGIPITHSDQVSVDVSCNNIAGPPFTQNLYIEYNNGGGFTPYAGSPYFGPSINANSGVLSNTANNPTAAASFEVQCYQ
jgi:hypothetical protein